MTSLREGSPAGGGGGKSLVPSSKFKFKMRKPSELRGISKSLKTGYEEELGKLAEIKLDANPNLLLPPTRTHVVRYPYAQLAGSAMAPPKSLLPSAPYPLLPLSPHAIVSPCNLSNEGTILPEVEDKPYLHGVPSTSSSIVSPVISSSEKHKSCCEKVLNSESLPNFTDTKSEVTDTSLTSVSYEGTSSPESFDNLSSTSPSDNVHILNHQHSPSQSKHKQRNDMKRKRCIENESKDLSAAYETLRRVLPFISDDNEELCELSILNKATAYIQSLSKLARYDHSEGTSSSTFEEFDLATRTTQKEEKL